MGMNDSVLLIFWIVSMRYLESASESIGLALVLLLVLTRTVKVSVSYLPSELRGCQLDTFLVS